MNHADILVPASRAAAVACLALVAGCTLAPDYQRPPLPVRQDWPSGPAYGGAPVAADGAPQLAEVDWRTFFSDAGLRSLIEVALAHNLDLRVAALNIENARAQYRVQRANLFPAVDASVSGTSERTPASVSLLGVAATTRVYSVDLGITAYELDLFGRVRSLKAQALEQYLSTEEAHRSQRISLIAEVASSYLTLAADRARLDLARGTLESQRQSLALVERRLDAGAASQLDLHQAQITVESARVDVAAYAAQVEMDRNALELLVGQPVDDAMLPAAGTPVVTAYDRVPRALPADVLLRRPDVLEAEHMLRAANANIGAARAAFFPKIELTASAGTTSGSLSNLFKAGTGAWTFAPSISVPIFDFGYNRASLDVAKVEKDIDIANYEKAIQTAFKEVSNALAGRTTYVTQVAADRDYVGSAQQYYDLAQARYRSGTDSFLTLLDAQRTLYTAQQQLVTDMLAKQSNLITLYKVLGGGWSETSAVAQR
jgi:multidrug efflux system outer membrane protein